MRRGRAPRAPGVMDLPACEGARAARRPREPAGGSRRAFRRPGLLPGSSARRAPHERAGLPAGSGGRGGGAKSGTGWEPRPAEPALPQPRLEPTSAETKVTERGGEAQEGRMRGGNSPGKSGKGP